MQSLSADQTRVQLLRDSLRRSSLDLLVCSLPENVLLLSGYWPVVGTSIALLTQEKLIVIAPEDEQQLAHDSRGDEVLLFQPGSLDSLANATTAVRDPLQQALRKLGNPKTVGIDDAATTEPTPYSALHLYGADLPETLSSLLPTITLRHCREQLSILKATLTDSELERVRNGCRLAGEAYDSSVQHVRAGMREPEVEGVFRCAFSEAKPWLGAVRQESFVWCMSGPNSAKAHAAYARTRARQLQDGDLVMMHCNSCVQGFWTDITRTFHLGEPDERVVRMYSAIAEASRAALAEIKPGAKASQIDQAARDVLSQNGFGKQFKHQTGHGVGFSAISGDARPRLHPKSPDILETGMIFNVEPAIYIEDFGGMRHCDVVAVTPAGAELLTPFQRDWHGLILGRELAAD